MNLSSMLKSNSNLNHSNIGEIIIHQHKDDLSCNFNSIK